MLSKPLNSQTKRWRALGFATGYSDLKADRTVEENFNPRGRSGQWRPFQLAFVLSVLPELVFPDDPKCGANRETVDVLFFPTGGGKTEAYLGAMAFSAAYRRLLGHGAGVSSVLRYTYRLLSTQQFARAATLICALETIVAKLKTHGRIDSDGSLTKRLSVWAFGLVEIKHQIITILRKRELFNIRPPTMTV